MSRVEIVSENDRVIIVETGLRGEPGAAGGAGDLGAGTDQELVRVNAAGTTLARAGHTITTLLAAAYARASHTGTQLASTISDFATAVGALLTWSSISGKPSTFDPSAHAASHASAGSDPITPAAIGAEPAGTAAAALASHVGLTDPHAQYALESALGTAAAANTGDFAAAAHTHAGADITSGTVAVARLPAASDTAAGVIELATSAEATTGTATDRALTPASLGPVTAAGRALLDDADAAAQRTTLGLGTAATTAASAYATAAQGATADTAVQPARTITAAGLATGGGDLSANRTITVTAGTTAGTACEGNDARLSDARTPTAHDQGSDTITSTLLEISGTTHTAAAADDGKIYRLTHASGCTVTIPDSLAAGWSVGWVQVGNAQSTFTVSGSMVLSNRQSHTKSAARWAVGGLLVQAANSVVLAGDTST